MTIMNLPETTRYLNKLVGSEKFFNDNAIRLALKQKKIIPLIMKGRKTYFTDKNANDYIASLTWVPREWSEQADDKLGF